MKTAVNDAEEVARILQNDYGFKVDILNDANRADIISALGKFRKTLGKKDNLLIYYAGHGWLDKEADEGYWLPVDAERDSKTNWVSNADITGEIKAIEAKHVLIVADSCYSGRLSRSLEDMRGIYRKDSDYFARIAQKRARSVLSSGGLEPVGDSGGKGLHSVFASAFTDALAENRQIMDSTEQHRAFQQNPPPCGSQCGPDARIFGHPQSGT